MQHPCSQVVAEHNSCVQQLAPLANAESSLATVDRDIAATSGSIGNAQSNLGRLGSESAYLEKRIHRNANPRFFHYLVINRKEKVVRLQGELAAKRSAEEQHRCSLQQEQVKLQQLQHIRGQANNAVALKQQLEAQRQRAFDAAVDSQPPTARLEQLRAGIAQQGAALAAEQALGQQVDATAQQIRAGLNCFQQSMRLYEEAMRVNESAKNVNREEAFQARREENAEWNGDDWRADNAEWREEQCRRREMELQARRDDLINEAQVPAMQAYEQLSGAFTAFPAEARARYPAQSASVGQVAFPKLKGANFGNAMFADIFGTMGAAINDARSGCKIRDNYNVVQRCIQMTEQQLAQVVAVEGAIRANVHSMQTNAADLERQRLAERAAIFNRVAAEVAAMATVAPAQPTAAVPTATATPVLAC